MRRSWVTLLSLLFVISLGVALNLAAVQLRGQRASWAWFAVVLLIMATIGAQRLSVRSLRRVGYSGTTELDDAAAQLARAVRAQCEREVFLLRLHAPWPLPVRWRQVPASSMGRGGTVRGTSPAEQAIPSQGLTDGLDRIVDVYRRIPSRRLVVLGGPGSGKTVLALRFVLDLLGSFTHGDPVPVIFLLASWNPNVSSLRSWLTDQLIITYPSLGTTGPKGENLASALVDAGRILPVLDGFDEIFPGGHDVALHALADTDLPWLLTSRTRECLAAVAATEVRSAAAAVELLPLDTAEVKHYLITLRDTRWDEVLAELDQNPDGPLATVLRTPLAVFLVRLVYASDRSVPNELLDPVRFGDAAAIERHLLDVFVPALFEDRFDLPPRVLSERAVRYLGFLARHLQQTDTHDLAWWRLHHAVPGTIFQLIGLGASLVGGVVGGLTFGLGVGLPVGLAFGLMSALVIGLVLRYAARSTSSPFPARIRLRVDLGRLARWLALGVGVGLVGALVALRGGGSWTAAVGWLAVGSGAGLVGALREAVNVRADIQRAGSPLLVLRHDRVLAAVQGAMTGLMAIPVVGISGGLLRSPVAAVVFCGMSALAGASSTAYYRYVISHTWLALSGRLPWALMSFLDDAHLRGALRQTGGVYRFAHFRVQEGLAARYGAEDVVHQPIDTAAMEAVSALREWLVDTAFERADVRAVVEQPRIEALKKEISAEIENTRTMIVGATTAARERFMASKARYIEQVGVPVLSRGVRVYAFAAAALAGFACTGLLISAVPFLGDVLMILSAGLVGLGVVLMAIPRLATIGKALQAQIVTEGDEPDDGSGSEPRPGPGKWVSSVIVALARLDGKWSVPLRILASAVMATVLAVFPAGLLHLWDPNYLPSRNSTPIAAAALAGMVFASLWTWARPWRVRSLALRSENPAHWPTDQEIKRAANARRDAVQAQSEWVKALLENGVLPLVGAKIEMLSRRSYATVLPEASVEKLGDITESAQFVPTETSAQLNRILNAMSSGAIGLSGPRGIGKSTLLRMFGDRRFGTNPDGLTLVVPAPTNYNSRDFLVHLFTRICELVLPAEASKRPAALARTPFGRRARPWWLLMACLGGLLMLGAAGWPMVVRAGTWLQDNVRAVAIVLGMMMMAVPLAVVGWSIIRVDRRDRRRDTSVEDMARHHLRSLRYLETNTLTRTGALKAPTGVELGGTTSRQHAEQVKTYPELVNDFRDFLDDLGLRLRSRANRSRIVICIDELDKIATAEQAERFINDIKTIFGVEGCFFLVAVSEDALASFARRALAVRTTFDSAFDSVIQMRWFLLANTRRLLVQRVLRLPEPFVWLCHSLAGGLPRDLNRTVRLMYDIRSTHNTDQLDRLATELIRQDIQTVAHGQLLRVSGRVDPDSGSVLRWIAAAKQLPLDSARLMQHCRDAPKANDTHPPSGGADTDELLLLIEQFRTYLYYVATMVRSFCEQSSSVIEQLERVIDDSANPMQHLADARVHLSVDPAMAWASVDAYQACLAELQLPTGGDVTTIALANESQAIQREPTLKSVST